MVQEVAGSNPVFHPNEKSLINEGLFYFKTICFLAGEKFILSSVEGNPVFHPNEKSLINEGLFYFKTFLFLNIIIYQQ